MPRVLGYAFSDSLHTDLVETALRLPAHRNTVVYRVRRIKEVLQLNIDQATVKFNLLLALYIREYLSM